MIAKPNGSAPKTDFYHRTMSLVIEPEKNCYHVPHMQMKAPVAPVTIRALAIVTAVFLLSLPVVYMGMLAESSAVSYNYRRMVIAKIPGQTI